jgi:hypothetical protein
VGDARAGLRGHDDRAAQIFEMADFSPEIQAAGELSSPPPEQTIGG